AFVGSTQTLRPIGGQRPRSGWAGFSGGIGTLMLGATGLIACAAPRLPSPETAVESYVQALKIEDAKALREMMTSESRESMSEQEIESILKTDKKELTERAQTLAS